MKTIKLTAFAVTVLFMLFSFAPGAEKINFTKTSITWVNTDLVIGDIPQGKPVSIDFVFKNTGESPVMITNVQASCGCTSTDFAKTPVLPGESTKIKAVFNAAAKGAFKKTVTVTTNAEETPRILTFSGTVIENSGL